MMAVCSHCRSHTATVLAQILYPLPWAAQGSAGTLDAVLEALMRGASTHIEPQTRKTCVQVRACNALLHHL